MRAAIFIPVRVESTRLPHKCFLQVKGKSVLEHLIERIKLARLPEMIVLCTTTSPTDDSLVDLAQKCGVQHFRGSEKDILKRHLDAATNFGIDFMANVDGDDIFCDPELVDRTVEAYVKGHADFIKWDGLPLGVSPCGFSVEALRKVCQMKDETDTETGWSRYFTDTSMFKVEILKHENKELNRPDIRLTLDYPEDFKLIEKIFENLYLQNKIFTLKDIIQLLERKPELVEINKNVREEYWRRFEKLAKIRLKGEVE